MFHFGKIKNEKSIFLKNNFRINKPLNNYLISMKALLHAKNQLHNPTHSRNLSEMVTFCISFFKSRWACLAWLHLIKLTERTWYSC